MRITKIQAMDKKRSKVYLDEEFAFVLYKGELRHFKIEENGELSQEAYTEITAHILPKRAKLRAMNLLQKHTYSEAGLRQKLKEGDYSEEMIDIAISYVKSFDYINDQRMAEDFIRLHLEDKSRGRIKQDLRQKGISADVIEQAFDCCAEEGFAQDETMQIMELLRKRHYVDTVADRKERAKTMQFLLRKGFSMEGIRRCMRTECEWMDS